MSDSKVHPDTPARLVNQQPSEAEITLLRRELQLNTRDAKILSGLAERHSPEDIAALLGLSVRLTLARKRFIIKHLREQFYERNPCTDQETIERAVSRARSSTSS